MSFTLNAGQNSLDTCITYMEAYFITFCPLSAIVWRKMAFVTKFYIERCSKVRNVAWVREENSRIM